MTAIQIKKIMDEWFDVNELAMIDAAKAIADASQAELNAAEDWWDELATVSQKLIAEKDRQIGELKNMLNRFKRCLDWEMRDAWLAEKEHEELIAKIKGAQG